MYTCNNNRNFGLFGGGCQTFWIAVIIALVIIWLHCGCSFGGYGGCGCGCDNGCDNDRNACC